MKREEGKLFIKAMSAAEEMAQEVVNAIDQDNKRRILESSQEV